MYEKMKKYGGAKLLGGKRYEEEPKLNMKKVIGVIVGIAVVVMFIITLTKLLKDGENKPTKVEEVNYFAVYTQDKWGVINNKGEIVVEPSYEEMILIPDHTKPVFLCTYNVDYNTQTYKTKAINENGEEILSGYDSIEAISNQNSKGQIWCEKDVFKVSKNGKYGVINSKGKEILACDYEEINALNGVEGYLVNKRDGKVGLCNLFGNVVIENQYKDIKAISEENKQEFIIQDNDGKYGIASNDKKNIIDPTYEAIAQINTKNIYVVKENGKWSIINQQKDVLVNGDMFDEVKEINEANIVIKKDKKYGIINTDGEEKVKTQYDDLTIASGEYYIAKKDGQYGVIDLSGQTKLEFRYKNLSYIKTANIYIGDTEGAQSDFLNDVFDIKTQGILSKMDTDKGYMRIKQAGEYKYYNFKFEEKKNTEVFPKNTLFLTKQNGKYGYINNKGEIVVECQYDDATEQNEYGFVSVNKGGKWGSLNKEGKVVAETSNDLKNNEKVDFIGKWHLGVAIEADYYTDI